MKRSLSRVMAVIFCLALIVSSVTAFAQEARKRIVVIGTGGTIAGVARGESALQSYRAGSLMIADMVNALGKDNLDLLNADVTAVQFANKGSGSYTMSELSALSMLVDRYLAQGYDGAVVTSGTDTMEEIGYYLDLTVRSMKPVVITGSMRPWSYLNPGQEYDGKYDVNKIVLGTDAPANLYNAIAIAASGKTYKFGTVLALNDAIHAVRDVSKTNAHRIDTFDAYMGKLGYIDEKRVSIYNVPARAMKSDANWATPFDLGKILNLVGTEGAFKTVAKNGADYVFPKVEIVVSYQEAGGGAIKGFVADGAKGIVTSGTGAGGISSFMGPERTAATEKGVVFVTTTRTGSGTMYDGTNDNSRIIGGDSLNAYHARVALILTLTFTSDVPTMHKWFREHVRTAM